MKITEVEAFIPHLPPEPPSWLSHIRVANPMSRYPEYGERRALWMGPLGPIIVRVKTDDGLEGLGLGGGGNPGCFIVEQHLKRLLVGQDPRDTERLWDQMFRASLPYGRKGLPIMAISGIDNALWDIKGKAAGQPVYKLLGGATKPAIPVYATGNQSAVYASLGFVGNKVAMPYGPWDGVEGMKLNEKHVADAREALGPDMLLMLDCYMAWDVTYTLRMAERLRRTTCIGSRKRFRPMTTMATPNCAAASPGRASPPESTNTRALVSTSLFNAAAPTFCNPISLGAAASPRPTARRRWQRPTASTSFPTWALRPAITFAWPMPIRLWLSSSSARATAANLCRCSPSSAASRCRKTAEYAHLKRPVGVTRLRRKFHWNAHIRRPKAMQMLRPALRVWERESNDGRVVQAATVGVTGESKGS